MKCAHKHWYIAGGVPAIPRGSRPARRGWLRPKLEPSRTRSRRRVPVCGAESIRDGGAARPCPGRRGLQGDAVLHGRVHAPDLSASGVLPATSSSYGQSRLASVSYESYCTDGDVDDNHDDADAAAAADDSHNYNNDDGGGDGWLR